MTTTDPIRDAVFALLPHFGIEGITDVEEGVTRLRAELQRLKSEEPDRYKAILSQSLGEMKMLSDVLDQYAVETAKVKG